MPHRQPGIIRDHRVDADDHRVDQRAQAMQMAYGFRPVDVARLPGRGRDAAIERLPELTDDEGPVAAGHCDRLIEVPERRVPRDIGRTDDVCSGRHTQYPAPKPFFRRLMVV